MRVEFVAGEDDAGRRVDVVLAQRVGITRALAQRALRNGLVTVGGTSVRPSHVLHEGQPVAGEIPAPEFSVPVAEDIPIEIRYEDEHVLVVTKPPGLVTHPARGHEGGTLVNALLALRQPLAGSGSVRPGIVHRLDKDTSGLLLVAKSDDAHAFLVGALRRREIERRYMALVRGRPRAASGSIDAPVGRHPVRRARMAVVGGGRPSVTHFRVVDSSDSVSLLDVTLETGRTHQIRVHLAHLGHPVLGDRTYGGASELSASLGLGRPFLHAWKLSWPDPSGDVVREVEDEPAPDLKEALAAAGLEWDP